MTNDLTAIRTKMDLCLYCNGSGAEGHPDKSTGCEFCYASGGTLDARSAVALCDEVERLRAENKKLRGLIADAVEIIHRADNTEGTCCCGESMLDHAEAMDCGHSPVDAGAYHAHEWQKDARAALAQKGGE